MEILFLDDSEDRIETFKKHINTASIVRTADECINKLKKQKWDYVFLDHDLGGEVHVDSDREDCGMEVVRWAVENKPIVEGFIIHSLNHIASRSMKEALRKAGYKALPIPFSLLKRSNVLPTLKKGIKIG